MTDFGPAKCGCGMCRKTWEKICMRCLVAFCAHCLDLHVGGCMGGRYEREGRNFLTGKLEWISMEEEACNGV